MLAADYAARPPAPVRPHLQDYGTAATVPRRPRMPEAVRAWSPTVPHLGQRVGCCPTQVGPQGSDGGPRASFRPDWHGATAKATARASVCLGLGRQSSGTCREPGEKPKGRRCSLASPCRADEACPGDGSSHAQQPYRGTSRAEPGCAGLPFGARRRTRPRCA
jgi:hypothetical protein